MNTSGKLTADPSQNALQDDEITKKQNKKTQEQNQQPMLHTIVHGWLTTGSSSDSLKKKNNTCSSMNPKQPANERTMCLIFHFSPHIHTALLLSTEVRELRGCACSENSLRRKGRETGEWGGQEELKYLEGHEGKGSMEKFVRRAN